MPRIKPPSSMPAKISPTPRKNGEMGEQVELSKMITKRQRIQHELQMMKQRMELLNSQLNLLDTQIETKEKAIQELRQSSPRAVVDVSGAIKPRIDPLSLSPSPRSDSVHTGNSPQFKTFHLNY